MASRGAQKPVSVSKTAKCPSHVGMQALYICSDCSETLACAKCVTTIHKKHDLIEIPDFLKVIKQQMKEFVETNKLHSKQALQDAEENVNLKKRISEEQIQKIKNRGVQMKTMIDELTERLVACVEKVGGENDDKFRKFKEKCKSLDTLILKCEKAMNSGLETELLNANRCFTKDGKCLSTHGLPQPYFEEFEFSFEIVDADLLEAVFGTATKIGENEKIEVSQEPLFLSGINKSESVGRKEILVQGSSEPEIKNSKTLTGKSSTSNSVSSQSAVPAARDLKSSPYKLLKKCSIVMGIMATAKYMSYSVAGNTIWFGEQDKVVYTVNENGDIMQEMSAESDIYGCSACVKTQSIWFCCKDKQICEGVTDIQVKFKINQEPKCICVTRDGSILIGVENDVSEYDVRGKFIRAARTDNTGRSTIQTPSDISQSDSNGDIAVVNWQSYNVVVLNESLELKFRFLGRTMTSSDGTNTNTGYSPGYRFNPSCVCFDKGGNLLIGDNGNKIVLAVSGSGKFLQTIYRCNGRPMSLVIQDNGHLWVGEDTERVVTLKYLE